MNESKGIWRGKRIDTKVWVEGYYVKFIPDSQPIHLIVETDGHFNIVDPETLGKCTGLPDVSKTLIFEGDILESQNTGNIGLVAWNDRGAGFVCRYKSDYFDTNGLIDYRARRAKIVGNIHDNPELLKLVTGEDIGNVAQDTLAPAT